MAPFPNGFPSSNEGRAAEQLRSEVFDMGVSSFRQAGGQGSGQEWCGKPGRNRDSWNKKTLVF
jgi:hypothetical protein